MITRSKEDMEKLYNAIREELTSLSDKDIFGDSNEADRVEMSEMSGWLKAANRTHKIPEKLDKSNELYLWLTGKSDMLDIYLEP